MNIRRILTTDISTSIGKHGRALLVSGIGVLAFAAADAALAEGAATNGPAPDASATQDDGALAEVVVTAQKRSENLERVPIAVTAISADALQTAGAVTTSDLVTLVPSLQRETTNNQVGSTNFSIRGIGTAVYGPQIESSVAVVIDGVTMARPQFGVVQFFDIDSVEVLRGPQGTLFGKNASVGLIDIITNDPKLGVFEGTADLSYGHRDTDFGGNAVTAEAVANLPVGDTSALRVSGFYNHNGEFIKNIFRPTEFLGEDEGGVRAKYLWRPDDHWSVLIAGDYIQEVGPSNSVFSPRFSAPGGFIASRDQIAGLTPSPNNLEIASGNDTTNTFEVGGAQADIVYNFSSGMAITDIVAYRVYKDSTAIDLDFTPDEIWNGTIENRDYRQFSDELRISSPTGQPLIWQAGLYYLDMRATLPSTLLLDLEPLATAPPPNSFNIGTFFVPTSTNQSYAAFGQATYSLTDSARLTAGGRFTRDEVGYTDNVYGSHDGQTYLAPLYPPGHYANSDNVSNFSWRLTGEYDLTSGVTSYVTWARGYKGPGFDQLTATLVRPEIPVNVELGLKAEVLDHRLTTNVALFDMNVHDFQAQAEQPGTNGFTTLNAGNLRARGVELELRARPIRQLTVDAGFTYNDAIYASFQGAPCYTGEPTGTSGRNVCFANGTTDASGNQLENAPRWVGTLGTTYDETLTDQLNGFGGVTLYYRSSSNFSAEGDPRTRIGSYALLGANAGVHSPDGKWRVAAFGRNLTDKRVPAYIFADPLAGVYGDAAKGGNYWQQFDENSFRTFGLNLSYKF